MKNWKRVSVIALALILVTALLPFGSFNAHAEEGDGNFEALGASYKVGDIIKFGHYEQDGNTANGKEEIEWQVLKVESDRVLVVSKYGLDCKKYNDKYANVTWETCTLRQWLNNDFKNAAFTATEQAKIPTVTIVNKNNPKYGTAGGNNTNDQIFCLSLEEMESYFGNYSWYDSENMYGFNQNLICAPTQYAENNGAYTYTITESDYNSGLKDKGYTSDVIGRRGGCWWLRSPGDYSSTACFVFYFGYAGVRYSNSVEDGYSAVRPALFLNIPVNPTSIKLNKTSAIMYYGNEMTLTATLAPSNVTEKTITWTSSNSAVATVNNGVVKAKSAGKTTITAKTVNGLTATCSVAVVMDNDPSNPFADLKAEGWQYNAARYVYDNGYMKGKGEVIPGKVLFAPNEPIDRSQFVQTLYNFEGRPAVSYVQKFSDVKSTDWFAKPVTWAAQNQIVGGNPDGTFGVTGRATREQMARMFYSYAAYKGYDTSIVPGQGKRISDFSDGSLVSSWAETALNWALSHGVMSGKGNNKLDPKGSATRVECATMLRNFKNAFSGVPLTFGLAADGIEEEEFIVENVDEETVENDVIENDVMDEEIIEEVTDEEIVNEDVDDNTNKEIVNEEVVTDEVINKNDEVINKEVVNDEVVSDEIADEE